VPSFDAHTCATLVKWLRHESEMPPVTLVGQFTKQGANIKAGHKWSYLRLDHDLKLWVGKDLIDQPIALRPTVIRGMRGIQLLQRLPARGESADAAVRVVREFVMSQGRLCRMDEIAADSETRTARHPYFPDQPIFIAKYKGLSTAHPFALTYDEARTIVAARTIPRGHPAPVHPVLPALGDPPIAYVLGGSLQHPAVNNLTGIVLDVPVARAGNIYRITAGETAAGCPRFHRICRHTGPQGVAVELENGIPIAIYTHPTPTDASTRQPLLVKRRWPNRLPQECVPSYITSRWLSMLPTVLTGQVVRKDGVVWVQNRPLFVGHRLAGRPAETIVISAAQAEQVGTQATFQVNVMHQTGDVAQSCGFTWQGRGVAAWSSEQLERIARMQPVAQRRVLEQASWLPLTAEMLSRGWLLGDVADLVRRVTDLGLGREGRIACHVQTAIRSPRGRHETEPDQIRRIKGELLEWLEVCDDDRSVSLNSMSYPPQDITSFRA
jgi:hypothetical protein